MPQFDFKIDVKDRPEEEGKYPVRVYSLKYPGSAEREFLAVDSDLLAPQGVQEKFDKLVVDFLTADVLPLLGQALFLVQEMSKLDPDDLLEDVLKRAPKFNVDVSMLKKKKGWRR